MMTGIIVLLRGLKTEKFTPPRYFGWVTVDYRFILGHVQEFVGTELYASIKVAEE